jgi:hypothetical protein
MTPYDWEPFLAGWSVELLSSELAGVFPLETKASGWVGSPGASEGALEATEARLGRSLPPSYRAFLQVSDGWPMLLPLLGRLWSADRIDWLAAKRSSLIDAWLMGESLAGGGPPIPDPEYLVYGEDQDPVLIRVEYLRSALEISSLDVRDDAIYLLNPQIVTAEGEWEAWFLASWLPGAIRYPSFWEMMQAEHLRFQERLGDPGVLGKEFIAYAREQLFSQGAEIGADVLLELIAQLQQETDRLLVDPEPGSSPTLTGYRRERRTAFEFVLARAREIEAQEPSRDRIRQRLADLANELESRSWQDMRAARKGLDLEQVLRAGMRYKLTGDSNELDQQFASSSRAAVLQGAAVMIRSLLGED